MPPEDQNASMAPLAPTLSEYPWNAVARAAFRTFDGKKLTDYQWAVYDVVRRIPCGHVATYATVSKAVRRGSPRSVGTALRNNPFSPMVPCHRVIASNLYIGGFFGEWGISPSEKNGSGEQCKRKIEMLAEEGVLFTAKGRLADENLIYELV